MWSLLLFGRLFLTESSKSPAWLRGAISSGWGLACIRSGTSKFSPVMTFKLWKKFSDSCLEVSESMEVNGKKTFGYDEPIIYKQV